jgi:hypothetical protein
MGADCAMGRIAQRCAQEAHIWDDHTPVVPESYETYRRLRDAGILVEGFLYLPISYDPSTRIDKGCFMVPDHESGQIWFINVEGELDHEPYMGRGVTPMP